MPGERLNWATSAPKSAEQQRPVRLVEADDLGGIDVEMEPSPEAWISTWGRPGSGNWVFGMAGASDSGCRGASYRPLSMSLTLDDLFASPDHYLHSFEGDAAVFVPMDREAYRRSIFLDGRTRPAANRSMRLPAGALVEPVRRPEPTGSIFHVAHCGSTLLARALDRPSTNLVLREPLALRQLASPPTLPGSR